MIGWPFGPVWRKSFSLEEICSAMACFFLDSVNSSKVPAAGIFLRFRPTGTGLLLALSRWRVLPGFSVRQV